MRHKGELDSLQLYIHQKQPLEVIDLELWLKNRNGKTDILEDLFLNENYQDDDGNTILHIAADKLDDDIVTAVLQLFQNDEASLVKLLSVKNKRRETAPALAARKSHADILRIMFGFLSVRQSEHFLLNTTTKGRTLLHTCAQTKKSEEIEFFSEHFAKSPDLWLKVLSATDERKNTAVYYAAELGRTVNIMNMLETLTEPQVISLLSIGENSTTALHAAAKKGKRGCITAMMSKVRSKHKKYKVMQLRDGTKETVLHKAAERGDDECVDTIMKNVIPEKVFEYMSMESATKSTALHLAVDRKKVETVKNLLERLKSSERSEFLKKTDDRGSTLNDLALCIHSQEIVMLLQEYEEEQGNNLGIFVTSIK